MFNNACTVQFRNIDDTIDAYVNNNVPALSIWHKRQLLFTCKADSIEEGESFLRDLLERLQRNGSYAAYTLCVYDNVEKGINNKTPFVGSFNFLLNEKPEQNSVMLGNPGYAGYVASPNVNALESEVRALRMAVNEMLTREALEEDDNDVSEDSGVLGSVERLLQHPLADKIVTGVLGLLNVGSNANKPALSTASLGGVSEQNNDALLAESLRILKELDSNFVKHLAKLATVAKSDPSAFKMFLTYLDNL